ncbi:MAG: hypothetical protein Q7S50_01625, partial [bacterium]|nr:hypothetical protein [bacterium]
FVLIYVTKIIRREARLTVVRAGVGYFARKKPPFGGIVRDNLLSLFPVLLVSGNTGGEPIRRIGCPPVAQKVIGGVLF